VGTFHRAGESLAYRLGNRLARRVARRLDRRCAVSPDALDLAQRTLGGEFELLFNGIEVDRFASGPVYPSDGPTVFFLGRHEPRKGLEVLLDAMAELPDDLRLWVGGDGPQHDELRERHGHDGRIEWLGRITDAERAARMRGCTVYCSPSVRGESFGMVLLEAMASGCALVASDLPGHRNVATDDVDALLTPVGDPAALAKAIRRVIDDDELRRSLVTGGRLRAEELSMARLADRYSEIYESVMAAPSRGRPHR
jgi:phosphatidylinositol alpha-mannosyltransferase